VLAVYRASRSFPESERFGLTSQLRRAAVSIPANIAEGCGRRGDRELARFLHIASGSASELEYYVVLAQDLGYLPSPDPNSLLTLATEVRRMVAALARSLRESAGVE
jgi:four helix bundle protein